MAWGTIDTSGGDGRIVFSCLNMKTEAKNENRGVGKKVQEL